MPPEQQPDKPPSVKLISNLLFLPNRTEQKSVSEVLESLIDCEKELSLIHMKFVCLISGFICNCIESGITCTYTLSSDMSKCAIRVSTATDSEVKFSTDISTVQRYKNIYKNWFDALVKLEMQITVIDSDINRVGQQNKNIIFRYCSLLFALKASYIEFENILVESHFHRCKFPK